MDTFIVAAIVFGLIAFAGYRTYKSHKNGGGCSGCSGCSKSTDCDNH